jgi:hypothetical protein
MDYRLTSLTLKNGAANVSSLAYAYSDGMNLTGITDNVTPANTERPLCFRDSKRGSGLHP